MTKIVDLTGQRFGRLVVIQQAERNSSGTQWHCQCDCGTYATVRSWDIRHGRTTSCGCYHKERVTEANTTHGDTRSKEWLAWVDMIRRCTDETRDDWKNYGGRGIRVHKKWLRDYAAFLAHIGRAPSQNHTLDRIRNNGHYAPGNVRWATRKQQVHNRRPRKRA